MLSSKGFLQLILFCSFLASRLEKTILGYILLSPQSAWMNLVPEISFLQFIIIVIWLFLTTFSNKRKKEK